MHLPAKSPFFERYLLPLAVILFVTLLAFLPRIGQLGFYKDDWHMIYHGHTYGANTITDSFLIDRPIMGQVNRLMYLILGDAPLAWHLFALAARLVGVYAFYLILRLLWPSQRAVAAVTAALFAVYPGFLQQPNAATFQNHFIGLGLALISILLNLWALRRAGWLRVLALAGSALCAPAYLFIYEYMIGLEVLRLGALLLMLRQGDPAQPLWRNSRQRNRLWRQALLFALPAWAAAGGFVFWRFVLFSSDRPATDAGLILSSYLSNPLSTLDTFLSGGIRDLVETAWLAWSVPLYTVWQTAGIGSLLLGLLLAFFAALAILLFLRLFTDDTQTDQSPAWPREALGLGLIAMLGALLPVTLAGRSVYFADQFDRYTLHAAPGAALFAAGLVTLIFNPRLRAALLAFLVGSAVLTHSLNSQYWAQFWEIQRSFWWQVTWRAPALQDGTLLMPRLPAGYGLAEDYEVFSPANLLYHPEEKALRIHGEVLNDSTALLLISQNPKSYRYIRFFELERDFRNALVIDWPSADSCAHFLDGNQPELTAEADALLYLVAPYSHIERVQPDAAPPTPLRAFFGREPDRQQTWCWYYQSASLARQRGDWLKISQLYEQAEAAGLKPRDASEWLPFYQAFAELNDQPRLDALAALIRADRSAWQGFCQLSVQPPQQMQQPAYQKLCAPLAEDQE